MLYVRIELWPRGVREKARVLGEGTITNTGIGGPTLGEYSVKLMKSPEYSKSGGIWKRGSVMSFPRLKLGPWDLLYRALKATVGSRN